MTRRPPIYREWKIKWLLTKIQMLQILLVFLYSWLPAYLGFAERFSAWCYQLTQTMYSLQSFLIGALPCCLELSLQFPLPSTYDTTFCKKTFRVFIWFQWYMASLTYGPFIFCCYKKFVLFLQSWIIRVLLRLKSLIIPCLVLISVFHNNMSGPTVT